MYARLDCVGVNQKIKIENICPTTRADIYRPTEGGLCPNDLGCTVTVLSRIVIREGRSCQKPVVFNKVYQYCHPGQMPRWLVVREAIGLLGVQKCFIYV